MVAMLRIVRIALGIPCKASIGSVESESWRFKTQSPERSLSVIWAGAAMLTDGYVLWMSALKSFGAEKRLVIVLDG